MDRGHEETEELLKEIEKKIKKEYKQANKEVEEKLNNYLEAFEKKDKEKRLSLKKGEITKEAYDKWRTQQILIDNKWQGMLDVLSDDYLNADKIARSIVNRYMPEVYAINHNFGTYQVEQGTNLNTSYSLYNRQTVERLFRDNPDLLPKSNNIEELIREKKVKRWNAQKINSAVTQAILQGEAIPKVAKRLRNVTDMDYRASVRNARTMITSVQNCGRLDAYKRAEKMGIETYKQWLAIHDNRTRHQHRLLDRQIQPVDKPFIVDDEEIMFPADSTASPFLVYNCRCTMKAVFPKETNATDQYNDKVKEYAEKKFPKMNARSETNNYWTMDRVGNDGNTIVVKTADSHLIKTKYGYALILDRENVVFLKEWQVNQNYYGNEVMLNKPYFNVKKWGNHLDFGKDSENLKWETWLDVAKRQQDAGNQVKWEKTKGEKMVQSFQKSKANRVGEVKYIGAREIPETVYDKKLDSVSYDEWKKAKKKEKK